MDGGCEKIHTLTLETWVDIHLWFGFGFQLHLTGKYICFYFKTQFFLSLRLWVPKHNHKVLSCCKSVSKEKI